MSGFYSVEGWNRDREARERQREGQAQGSLLAQIPADAPYDDPDAVIHVWTGKKWISYEKWLATAPIAIREGPSAQCAAQRGNEGSRTGATAVADGDRES